MNEADTMVTDPVGGGSYLGKRLALVGAGLWAVVLLNTAVFAQAVKPFERITDTLPKEAGAAPSEAQAPLEERLAEVEEKLEHARMQLANAKAADPLGIARQFNVPLEKVQEKLRLLTAQVRAYEERLATLTKLGQVRKATQDLEAEMAAWQGFPEAPPYPIDLVDSIRRAIRNKTDETRSIQVELNLAQRDRRTAEAETQAAQTALDDATQQFERARTSPEKVPLRWLMNLAILRTEVGIAARDRAAAAEQFLTDTVAFHDLGITFLERKLQIASAHVQFDQRALDQKLEAVDQARQALREDIDRATRALQALRDTVSEARVPLPATLDTLAPDSSPSAQETGLPQAAEQVLETRRIQADTLTLFLDTLNILLETLDAEQLIWEKRFEIAQKPSPTQLDAMNIDLAYLLAQVDKWHSYFNSNLDLTLARINAQRESLAARQPEQGDKALAEEALDSYRQREAFYRRGLARIDEVEDLLHSWQDDISEQRKRIPVRERITGFLSSALALSSRVWNYEIFSVGQEKMLVDGREVTRSQGIPIRKIALAALIVIVGIALARRLAARVRRFTMTRFKVEESVAVPIEKIVYYLFLVFVFFFALTTVRIPLTIFAYFGGALAIGVGFGAQNLINNFISGLILLLERPIKVGDIVEIDGLRGRVRNIGARCSQVRLFDGVDILVPNSTFLEKNVVNWTLADRTLRFSVSVGVAYGSPTQEVARLITQAIEEHKQVLKYPEPLVLFDEFGDSALVFTAYFWLEVSSSMDSRIVASDLRYRIQTLFREAGITIAFPQRDVHLDGLQPIQVELVESKPKPPENEKAG